MENADGVDNPSTSKIDENVDKDVNRVDKLGTITKKVTSSNGNHNSKTRYLKIVSFSINNIIGHSYSMQVTTEMMKLMKNLLGLKQPEAIIAMATTVKPTSDVLNFVSFPSIIDQVIMNILQL